MFQLIKNKKKFVWAIVFVLAAGWGLAVSTCLAADAINPVKTIAPPPDLNHVAKHLHQETKAYDVEGTLNAVGADWITVNDFQFTVEPGASIRGEIGSFVGLTLNDRGNVISCKPTKRP